MVARSNFSAARVKPEVSELLHLRVVRRERVSPNFMRVTLGGGDIDRFTYLGFDQWFRLFISVSEDSLSHAPAQLNTLAYLKYLTVSKSSRPVLRNYTVRAYRPDGADGPEIDVDFVLHGSADHGTAGPATAWAQTCAEGDPVAIIDEGIAFSPPPGLRSYVLVADETGLPAIAGILRSLPADAMGRAVLEIPTEQDRQELSGPAGMEISWVSRDDASSVPGRKALDAILGTPVPDAPFYGWTVGESALPVAVRRHWVKSGVPKDSIMFCGYWRASRRS